MLSVVFMKMKVFFFAFVFDCDNLVNTISNLFIKLLTNLQSGCHRPQSLVYDGFMQKKAQLNKFKPVTYLF